MPCGEIGMPYHDNKAELLDVYAGIIGRKVSGLSGFTLGERDQLLRHYQKQGLKLFKPFVGKHLKGWRKGDPEKVDPETQRPMAVAKEKKPLVGKIGALLANMQLSWRYADGISNRMFGIRVVEWCSPVQLHKVVAALMISQRRHHA